MQQPIPLNDAIQIRAALIQVNGYLANDMLPTVDGEYKDKTVLYIREEIKKLTQLIKEKDPSYFK